MGYNWEAIDRDIKDITVSDVAVIDNNLFVSSLNNGVYFSGDSGAQWTEINNGISTYIRTLAVSGNRLFAAGDYGNIFSTDDNGTNWTKHDTPAENAIRSIAVSGTSIFAASSGNGVIYSGDGGNSWTEINDGLMRINFMSLAVRDKSIYAGSLGGSIWRRNLSDITGVKHKRSDEAKTLHPGTPAVALKGNLLTFRFSLHSTKEIAIRVFNLTGKLTGKLIDKNLGPGFHSIACDISKMPPGCYIINMQVGDNRFSFSVYMNGTNNWYVGGGKIRKSK